MVAVINNFGGFYQTWVYFNEAQRQGARINLPCINHGQYKTSIIGKDVYIGFIHITNLQTKISRAISFERDKNGIYKSLEDFVERIHAPLDQMIILIRIGAFRFTGTTKSQLLWEVHLFFGKTRTVNYTGFLFNASILNYRLPELKHEKLEDAYDEFEFLGFPVTVSHFDILETTYRGEVLGKDLKTYVGKKVRMVGRLVTVKYVRTIKKELMHFGTFLDMHGEFFDTVHFPDSLKDYPFRGKGIYLIQGTVNEEFDFHSVTVEKMAKLPLKEDPRNG